MRAGRIGPCGSRAFIDRAYRMRKLLGGAMRQVGVLAAAGIVALEKMTDRLGEDHRRARSLASGLAEIQGLVLDTPAPASNMVYVHLDDRICPDAVQVQQLLVERA